MTGIVAKRDLGPFLSAAMEDYTVYGPVAQEGGVALAELTSGAEARVDLANTKLSAKGLFFPQCEAVYTYEGDELRDVPPPDRKVVVFGMRPCDARGLHCLEAVFGSGEAVDPYYCRRRENAVVISLACSEPCQTCFCTSVGGSPAGREGTDIIAFDLGEALLFEACSDKGHAFMQAHSEFLREPSGAEVRARAEQEDAARERVPPLNAEGLKEKLELTFDSPLWSAVAQRCLGCGVCTYFCPTCHCFALFDDDAGSCGTKTKNWDSCMFPSFTLEASGHNPRTAQGDRMRQRVMHKFSYTVENLGETFCVGCGRCVTSCPVNVDLREIIAEVAT